MSIVFVLSILSGEVAWGAVVLLPDIMTNLKNGYEGKKIISCEVALTTSSDSDAVFIQHYQPQLRNTIIDLLNQESSKTLLDMQSLAEFEQNASIELNKVLQTEINRDVIEHIKLLKVSIDG